MHVELKKPSNRIFIILVIVSLFLFVVGGGVMAWAHQFYDRIGPNVYVGDLNLSGLNRLQANELLQKRVDALISTGVDLSTIRSETPKRLTLTTLVGSDSTDDVHFAIDKTIDRAMALSHESNPFFDGARLIANTFTTYQLTVEVALNEEDLKKTIYQLFPEEETLAQDPRLVFSFNGEWSGTVIPGKNGTEFTFDAFFETLAFNLEELRASPLKIALVSRIPSMSNAQVQEQIEELIRIIKSAPITFTHTDEGEQEVRTWTMTQRELADMLKPDPAANVLDREAFDLFLDIIADDIEQPAQNARINIENGRVIDFAQSKKGIRLDRDGIFAQLVSTLTKTIGDPTANGEPAKRVEPVEPINVMTLGENPVVATGDVNDLGITEILGSGISSYKGSPKNRLLNIQNGVNLLNGTLIAPDETFSLLKALQPFTLENGYLPELVIKGDKILPEIGGGLCQIGTTTFRSVMNSGLPIVERQNHSLVVSYYNDLSNGNPGTDATIYEPAPDFKFTNDTGRYVLFQAENLTDKQQLKFTLWGTKDGRKGSYTSPTVIRWIPAGEKKVTETLDLEPGKETCQAKHVGADTTFDYTVVKADGTTQVTTYASHYRPLPEICLVGVEKLTEPSADVTPGNASLPVPFQNDAQPEVIPTPTLNN